MNCYYLLIVSLTNIKEYLLSLNIEGYHFGIHVCFAVKTLKSFCFAVKTLKSLFKACGNTNV